MCLKWYNAFIMRKRFEGTLQTYRDISKSEQEGGEDERIQHALDWNLDRYADAQETPRETQVQIYRIQKEKQRVMRGLKDAIRKLDNPEKRENQQEGEKFVEFIDGKYQVKIDGEDLELSVGDIMTDGEWGLKYYLDPDSVPRNIRKEYLIEKAKRKVQEMLDEQIFQNETTRSSVNERLITAYHGASGRLEAERIHGFIAEKLVKNYLKKLMFDFKVNYQIKHADIHQDVIEKIDFIIRKRNRDRGIDVEPYIPQDKDVGIQFTLKSGSNLRNKKRSLERHLREEVNESGVEDIVLVSVPIDFAKGYFKVWEQVQEPGGPERLIPLELKEQLFRGALEGLLTEKQIEKSWRTIEKAEQKDWEERSERVKKKLKTNQSIESVVDAIGFDLMHERKRLRLRKEIQELIGKSDIFEFVNLNDLQEPKDYWELLRRMKREDEEDRRIRRQGRREVRQMSIDHGSDDGHAVNLGAYREKVTKASGRIKQRADIMNKLRYLEKISFQEVLEIAA